MLCRNVVLQIQQHCLDEEITENNNHDSGLLNYIAVRSLNVSFLPGFIMQIVSIILPPTVHCISIYRYHYFIKP